jgi:putative endonuclease
MSTDLPSRIESHREGLVEGFAKRYRCHKLIYYAGYSDADEAYMREHQIKGWSRLKKMTLIASQNPLWKDLYEDLIGDCS